MSPALLITSERMAETPFFIMKLMVYHTTWQLGSWAHELGRRAQGQLPSPPQKKWTFLGNKIDTILSKIIHVNFIYTQRILLDDYSIDKYHLHIQFNLWSWSLSSSEKTVDHMNCNRNKVKLLPHVGLFTVVWLGETVKIEQFEKVWKFKFGASPIGP